MKRLYGLLYSLILMLVIANGQAGAETTISIEGDPSATTGTLTYFPYISNWGGEKTQIIYKASELSAFGLEGGTVIRGLALKHRSGTNMPLKRFRVRMAHTQLNQMSEDFITENLEVVKGGDNEQSQFVSGTVEGNFEWKAIEFDNDFTWNGTDNIIVEIAWTNGDWGNSSSRLQNIEYFVETNSQNVEQTRTIYKPQDNIQSLENFSGSGNDIASVPKIQFIIEPAYKRMVKTNPTDLDYLYLDPNSMSEAKELDVKIFNVPPRSKLVIVPSKNAHIATTKDAADWVTYPDTLTISGISSFDERKIWAKIKSGDKQPTYTAKLDISIDTLKATVNLKASSSVTFKYCKSGAEKTKDSDIGNVTIKKGDTVIFSNGNAEPIYSRPDANKTYSDFTQSVAPPTLKMGEEYQFSVAPIIAGKTLISTTIQAYIDFNNDYKLTEDEMIYKVRTKNGSNVVDNSHFKEIAFENELIFNADSVFLLRVIQSEDTEVEPCGIYSYGETEDYIVKLIPGDPYYISKVSCEQISPVTTDKGTKNLPILRASVYVQGTHGDMAIRQLVFDTEGSYSLDALKKARLYYVKDDEKVSSEHEIVGEIIENPNGNMVFTPVTPIGVKLGKHNFVLTYDISDTPDEETVIDARFKGLYISGTDENFVKEIFDPKGVTIINADVTYSMSFEGLGSNFSDSEWRSVIESNHSRKYWSVINSKSVSGIPAKDGEKLAYFNAYSAADNQKETLISEKISLEEEGSKTLSFWFYRHDHYGWRNGTTLEVLISDKKTIDNTAHKLETLPGSINPLNTRKSNEPVESTDGWYKYSYKIPETYNTEESYLFFRAVGDWYNRLFLDDIEIRNSNVMQIAIIDTLPMEKRWLLQGAENKVIGGIDIKTLGGRKKVILKSLAFDLKGTTDLADISKIKIWRMPDNNDALSIDKAEELVSMTDLKFEDNIATFQNIVLNEGGNKLYVTVDIKEDAKIENFVDIDFKKITITRQSKENTFQRIYIIKDGNAKGKAQIKGSLEGEYVIGGPEVSDKYFPNLFSAVGALNELGSSGNVIFAMNSDEEVYQDKPIVINNYYRKDTTSTLTIYPKDKIRTISGRYTSKLVNPEVAFFALVGVSDVIIDGRINRSDDNREKRGIIFENKGKRDFTTAIVLSTKEPDSDEQKTLRNIQINNTELSCGGNNLNEVAIYITGKDMENIRIINNKISNANYGVFIEKPDNWNTVVTNLQICNNYLGNAGFENSIGRFGILVRNAEVIKIDNNEIENVNTSANASTYGIYVGEKSKNVQVLHNRIQGIYGRNNNYSYGIVVVGDDTEKNTNIKVNNNVVKKVLSSLDKKNSVVPALVFNETDSVEIYHNTIVLDGDKNEIPYIGTNEAKSLAVTLGLVKTNHTTIKNNAFANRVTAQGRVSGGKGMYIFEDDENTVIDNNAYDIDIANDDFFAFKNNTFKTFDDFKELYNTWDQNSSMTHISLDPVYPILGTISGKTALSENMRAPAIVGLEDLKDIHGNTRPTDIVTKGADQVSATIKGIYITPEYKNICTPGKGEIKVEAEVGEFDDGIARSRQGVTPQIVYDWQKNGQHIDNLRTFMEDVTGDGNIVEVLKPVNSNVFYPEVLRDNLANPDIYTVKLSGFGKTTEYGESKVTGEEPITITKQMDKLSELCTENGATKLSVETAGTISGYQWQKEIGNKWVDLEGDTQKELNVSLTDAKYGEGKYRVFLKDGKNHCSQGGIFSEPSVLKVVDPVKNAVLFSPQADANGIIVQCEGEPLNINLKSQELEGDVFGYRWEEFVDGQWVECNLVDRDYIINYGINVNTSRPSQSAKYRLVVLGSQLCDTKEAISNVIDVTINPYAKIIKDAKPTIVCKDEMITIALEVEAENPRYQWQKDGVDITVAENITANKPIFIIEKAKYEDAGSYQATILVDGCIEDGSYGKLVSKPATVFVMNETQIVQQPENINAIKGRFARFEVKANAVGAPPHYVPEYQWFKGTKKLEDGNKYSGVNANILIINNVTEADATGADYYVVVKGLCGDTLISNRVKMKITSLAFNKHLENKEVCEGSEVKLEVNAETTYPNATINYEWHYVSNGVDRILQNVGNTLTFTAKTTNEGQYYVLAKVDGIDNNVKSNVANVKVSTEPTITKGLGVTNTKAGEEFTLTVKASGNDLVYKWYRDGEVIEAESATITRSESEAGSHTYKVEVSNMCGTVSSEASVVVEQNMANVEEANAGFTVSKIIPNPVVTNEAKFSVNIEEASYAEISITDARGKSTQFFSGNITGKKEFSVNTNGYVNGTYYIVININGKTITRSFVVVK